MSMTTCKDCGATISGSARACPNCGANRPHTHWFTWLVVVGLGFSAIMVAAVLVAPADPPPPATCPPMDRTFMVLPDDRAYATLQFLDRARRFNEGGQCVVYANWSRDRGQYIFQVKNPGELDHKAKNIYIPEADLHR